MPSPIPPQPLRLAPIDVPRIWGGTRFPAPAGGDPIGERWIYSTLPGQVSRIMGGAHDGWPIDALCTTAPIDYLGAQLVQAGLHALPLLVKLVDTSQPLSVQVHPDDRLAHASGLDQGKSEMWYVLSTTPESFILLGLQDDTSPDALADAVRRDELPHLLNHITPQPGDFYHVPAGQIHALGPGLLLLEVQQPSDATYRLYDWARLDIHGKPRALDIPHALEASSLARYAVPKAHQQGTSHPIVHDPHFSVSLLPMSITPTRMGIDSEAPYLLFCAEGSAIIQDLHTDLETRMEALDLLFVPAACQLTVSTPANGTLLMVRGPAEHFSD